MKRIYILTVLVSLMTYVKAQESQTKLYLSGFEITLIPSDEFRIVRHDDFEVSRETVDGVLEIGILDQTGKVPKGSITLYAHKPESLRIHNCKLVMDKPLDVDSLDFIADSSVGELKVKAEYLSVNTGAGSNITVKGKTNFFNCESGAGANLDASALKAKAGNVDVRGAGTATVNIKKVKELYTEPGKSYYVNKATGR